MTLQIITSKFGSIQFVKDDKSQLNSRWTYLYPNKSNQIF